MLSAKGKSPKAGNFFIFISIQEVIEHKSYILKLLKFRFYL